MQSGCALNCLANKELLKTKLKEIYIMPASSDRGLSLGSAIISAYKNKENLSSLSSMFLGNKFSEKYILNELTRFGIKYKKVKIVTKIVQKKY